MKKTVTNKKILRDIILAFSIISVSLIALLIFRESESGNYVSVSIKGAEKLRLSLNQNIERIIETENGNNILKIENGKAYISDADCPDLLCAKHRAISKTGETIVCLPHSLVIRVVSDKNGLDITV